MAAGHLDIWSTPAACTYSGTHTSPHGLGGGVVDRYGIGKHPGHDLEHSHAHDHEHWGEAGRADKFRRW